MLQAGLQDLTEIRGHCRDQRAASRCPAGPTPPRRPVPVHRLQPATRRREQLLSASRHSAAAHPPQTWDGSVL